MHLKLEFKILNYKARREKEDLPHSAKMGKDFLDHTPKVQEKAKEK